MQVCGFLFSSDLCLLHKDTFNLQLKLKAMKILLAQHTFIQHSYKELCGRTVRHKTAHSGIIVTVFHSAVIHRLTLLVLLRMVCRGGREGEASWWFPLYFIQQHLAAEASSQPVSLSLPVSVSFRSFVSSAADVFKCDCPRVGSEFTSTSHNYLPLTISAVR